MVVRKLINGENQIDGITGLTIYENTCPSRGSKWEKYRIDEMHYNDMYKNLMKFLNGIKYFGIEDIKK